MEITIGIAQTHKYAVRECGDSVEMAERAQGGISVILSDGQGSGKAARITSRAVVNKAASLIADGARDGAVARTVHDYLFALKDGKVSATLAILSADLDTQTAVFCRNSHCPVLLKMEYGVDIYDQNVNPIGVHKRTKPLMYELPLEMGMILVTYTDGIQAAGRKKGREINLDVMTRILTENQPQDASFIAESILDYALELDDYRAGDDMTVAVMGICDKNNVNNIKKISVSFPG